MSHRLTPFGERAEVDCIYLAVCEELNIGLYDPLRQKVATALIELVDRGERNTGALHKRTVLKMMNR